MREKEESMAESILKIPSTASEDLDFLAFSFNGKHSYEDFGLYRTSDGGSTYNNNLFPALTEKTTEVQGGDGLYYFGTQYKQKDFNISIAFDNLNEEKYKAMRAWLNPKQTGSLWFSEYPYKIYTAKVVGAP
jgi:predicted phage tail component-like protein